jgi:hypothetical protein
MRTRKAVIEAGLSGAATGLPGGGSRSAAELVSTVASIVCSSMSAREGKNVTFLLDSAHLLHAGKAAGEAAGDRLKADEGMRASISLCRLANLFGELAVGELVMKSEIPLMQLGVRRRRGAFK